MGIDESVIFAAIDLVSAGILGLAFILLVVFCVLASKTWNWINIVFVILTFMAGVGAIFGLTKVYQQRTKWIAEVDKYEKAAETALLAAEKQINGDKASLTYDPGCLRYADFVLAQETAGRGRVWPNGQVTADGNNRTFTMSSARPAGFQPLQDVVLFAFAEQNVTGQLHPAGFIGSVRVVSETASTVTLQPVALAGFQQYVTPSVTWSLFEKMPLDRRGIFKKATIAVAETNPNATDALKEFAKSLQDENAELNISQFRDVLQSWFLQPQKVGLDPASLNPNSVDVYGVNNYESEKKRYAIEYEKLIDRYAFDGLPIRTIDNWVDSNSANRVSPRFDPSPEEVFIQYEFVEPSRKGYVVDAIGGSVAIDGLFDNQGHAIETGLHHGGEVNFAKGDTVLVDQRSAEGYQRNGEPVAAFSDGEEVKETDKFYIRQVRDYPYEFTNLTFESAKADAEIIRLTQSNVVQQTLIDDANDQIQERSRVINDLTSDKTNLQNDLDTINAMADLKKQEVAALTQTIASLESKIDAAYKELRALSIKLSRKAFAGR